MGREMRRGLTLCLPVLLSVTLLAQPRGATLVVDEAATLADMDRWGIDRYVHAEEYRKLRAWLTNRFRYLDGVIRNYPIHP